MSAACWRLNPRIALHWRDWGHDSVAFERLSAGTYQFDPLAAAVVSCFEEGLSGRDEIFASLAGDAGDADAADIRTGIDAAVQLLLRLGWIEPAAPR